MLTQIREKHLTTEEELRVMLEVERAENESIRRQLVEAHEIIKLRDAVIKILEAEIEAIGADGVSRLMGENNG